MGAGRNEGETCPTGPSPGGEKIKEEERIQMDETQKVVSLPFKRIEPNNLLQGSVQHEPVIIHRSKVLQVRWMMR
jgi:hypothetical protein